MPRIDLPGGFWADLKEPGQIRERDVQTILLAGDGKEGMARTYATRDAQLTTLITAWTVTDDNGVVLPTPRERPDSIGDLTPAQVNALVDGCGYSSDVLFPGSPSPMDPDPDSPTVPSSD